MSDLTCTNEPLDLDPEVLKKAGLYKLIEELVLSEHERYTRELSAELSNSNKGHVIEQPSSHGGSEH